MRLVVGCTVRRRRRQRLYAWLWLLRTVAKNGFFLHANQAQSFSGLFGRFDLGFLTLCVWFSKPSDNATTLCLKNSQSSCASSPQPQEPDASITNSTVHCAAATVKHCLTQVALGSRKRRLCLRRSQFAQRLPSLDSFFLRQPNSWWLLRNTTSNLWIIQSFTRNLRKMILARMTRVFQTLIIFIAIIISIVNDIRHQNSKDTLNLRAV